jgi:hypothetical protein
MDHIAPLRGVRGARGTAGFLLRLHSPQTAGQARDTRQGRPTTWPTDSVAGPWNETIDRFEFDRAPHAVRLGTPPRLARREAKGSGTLVVQEGRGGGGGHAFVAAASRRVPTGSGGWGGGEAAPCLARIDLVVATDKRKRSGVWGFGGFWAFGLAVVRPPWSDGGTPHETRPELQGRGLTRVTRSRAAAAVLPKKIGLAFSLGV